MASPSSPATSPPPSVSPKREHLLLTAPASPAKKSAPLPWSHPETLALIQAYQEKWYSVKKGPLKSFQWEEISVTVAARCGFDEPSRTSTQCRHKIEKLRKRYRSDSQKPYPNSWQYFELMDHLERGPMPITARPIAIVKSSFPNYVNNNYNDVIQNYGSFYSGSADYLNKNNNSIDGCGSDESDEEWNKDYGMDTTKKKRSKSIHNDNLQSDGKRVWTMSGKRKKYYDDDDRDYDEEDMDDFEDEEKVFVDEEMEEGGGESELAAEIRGFTERFMRMENKKIEMMRETERNWMEMEKKKMDMILKNNKKIIDSIGNAFGAH